MARFEISSIESSGIAHGAASADMFFRLGMMYASGRTVEADLVSAHKWFNIAASRGHAGAAGYRQELAREMSAAEVSEALRGAREWLRLH